MPRFLTWYVSEQTGTVKYVKNTTRKAIGRGWSAPIFLRGVARALVGIPIMLLHSALGVISILVATLLSFLIGYGITLAVVNLLN